MHWRVSQDVAVIGEEDLVIAKVWADTPQPLSDRGVESGVNEGNTPVTDIGIQQFDMISTLAEHEIVRCGLPIVEEVVLDCLGTVPQTQNELGMAEVGVVAHDMPENWPTSDRHHRLGQRLVVCSHSHAEPAAE